MRKIKPRPLFRAPLGVRDGRLAVREDTMTEYQHLKETGIIADDAEADARLKASAPALLLALIDLRKEIRGLGVKLNVRKHFSYMVAEAAANTAIHNATVGQS
jgi:hypothetical protein